MVESCGRGGQAGALDLAGFPPQVYEKLVKLASADSCEVSKYIRWEAVIGDIIGKPVGFVKARPKELHKSAGEQSIEEAFLRLRLAAQRRRFEAQLRSQSRPGLRWFRGFLRRLAWRKPNGTGA